jgi:hypothetical protein
MHENKIEIYINRVYIERNFFLLMQPKVVSVSFQTEKIELTCYSKTFGKGKGPNS